MKVTATTETVNVELMEWDTEFWGVPVARTTGPSGISEWAAMNSVGMVCLLVDSHEPEQAQEAEERGFRFMDIRVQLETRCFPSPQTVRLAKAEDTDRLCDLAREAFVLTRFYADPRFDDSLCGELYATWTRNLCEGDDLVLVADRDGVPVGYVTVHKEGRTAKIGLIAVAADWRGQQIGRELMLGATDWAWSRGCDLMVVVTQGRNIGAVRTFESCGFKVTDTSLWFHKWYRP